MKFAQFQSTYKPIPTQVYEQTGKELESKYFRNREQFSLLRQAMANSKVEDRNIGHLAKATADVEGVIDEVNGKWHYANNALFAAKDRLVTDKALNASIEDYAKSQASKQGEQKRFEEGKIDQDALNAFFTNDKRYNNKAIEIDENGQTINRWSTPTPPPKVDTEKKVLEIVDQLTKHKDTLDLVYKDNPRLQGFVDQYITSGKSPELIASAVRDWLRTTPEVKQYYNYINDAKVFNAVTERGEDGKYLQDPNGEFIQKDLTPADFRAIGIQIADDWTTPSNVLIKKGKDNLLVTQPIEGLSSDFRQTGAYKELIENGLTPKQAMQELYKGSLTDLQLENIVNFSRKFGFAETDINTLEDKAYWFEMDKKKEKEKAANVAGAYEGTGPMYDASYTPDFATKAIDDLNKKLEASTNPQEIARYQTRIDNIRAEERMLRNSFLDTPQGQVELAGAWEEFINDVPRGERDYYKIPAVKKQIEEFLSGRRDDVAGVRIPEKQSNVNVQGGRDLAGVQGKKENLISIARTSFERKFTKAIQEGKFSPKIQTTIFHDKDGKPSPMMVESAKHVMSNGHEWIIPSSLTKQGEPMTVADWYEQSGINPEEYDVTIEFGKDNYTGYDVLRFYPKKDGVKQLPPDKAMKVIQPNPDNRNAILLDRARMLTENKSENAGEAQEYIDNTVSNITFGHIFEPIRNSLALGNKISNGNLSFDDFQKQRVSNIPVSINDNKTFNGEIDITNIGTYNGKPVQGFALYQLDPNTNARVGTVVTGSTLDELQYNLYKEYTK